MTEKRIWCTISQQPCGIDGRGHGNGQGNSGSCELSMKFLRDIYEILEPKGAKGFWTEDKGDTLEAGYTSSHNKKIVMRIQKGDTVG